MEYGRGTRGYAALKLREQGYKTVTSHIMYCTDLRSTCIYSTYNTRGMSNMQLKGGPHGAWAGACRTSSAPVYIFDPSFLSPLTLLCASYITLRDITWLLQFHWTATNSGGRNENRAIRGGRTRFPNYVDVM